ncbi:helix-turn-helix domain-containing protein [Streptomyces albogriseolus]
MIAASQWLHATTGRIATDPYSWMQAVHWIHGSGLYTNPHNDGPKTLNQTTIAVAQEIAALKECRPSIAYLARKVKLSPRSVKYHLRMLRETGLLVYRSKGTRIAGVGGRASEFERTIPVVFDEALGIRTVGEGATRRPVGIAEKGRKLIGKLAKKAARKTRRPRRRTPSAAGIRCTPMQGGTSTGSSAGSTHSPSESKLASGTGKSPTIKSSKRGPRKLNKVGRRYQLARELLQMVPWLHNASVARVAWIVRHVADEGWTALEVQAAAEGFIAEREPRRPSAVLAWRLAGAHQLYTTPERRQAMVEVWQDSRRAEKARHAEPAFIPAQQGPRSLAARRELDQAFAAIRARLAPAIEDVTEDQEQRGLEDLTPDEITSMRVDAMRDPGLIFAAIEICGEGYARRLYSNRLVDQTLALHTINTRNTVLTPAF